MNPIVFPYRMFPPPRFLAGVGGGKKQSELYGMTPCTGARARHRRLSLVLHVRRHQLVPVGNDGLLFAVLSAFARARHLLDPAVVAPEEDVSLVSWRTRHVRESLVVLEVRMLKGGADDVDCG